MSNTPQVNSISDIIQLTYDTYITWFSTDVTHFIIVITLIILASVTMGSLCLNFGRLINKVFVASKTLKILAIIFVVLNIFLLLPMSSADFLKPVVASTILKWQYKLSNDTTYNSKTFEMAYHEVKKLLRADGVPLEDFSKFPPPPEGNLFPITNEQSRVKNSEIYAERILEHFYTNHPLLSKILWASNPKLLTDAIKTDIERFFAENPGRNHPAQKSVELAALHIQQTLEPQIPRVIVLVRIALLIVILLLWIPLFILVSYIAWNELKVAYLSN